MYRVDDGRRLPVSVPAETETDRVLLPAVDVKPADAEVPLEALEIRRPMSLDLDGLTLLGYDLYRLCQEHEADPIFRPGDAVHLNLYWKARQTLPELAVTLQLLDDRGTVRAKQGRPIGGVSYPTSRWRTGEVVRDQYNIGLAADTAPGSYRLNVCVTGKNGVIPPFSLDPFVIR
jgi:hypothetical protein